MLGTLAFPLSWPISAATATSLALQRENLITEPKGSGIGLPFAAVLETVIRTAGQPVFPLGVKTCVAGFHVPPSLATVGLMPEPLSTAL